MNINLIPNGKAVSVEVECIGSVPQSTEYHAKRDASLSFGGIEVVVTTDRSNGPVSIPALEAVKACKIDNSCGLHVHVDVRDLDVVEAKRVYRNLLKASNILKALVPPSRLTNRYCRWRSNDRSGTRYSALNFQSYYKFKTIEFRMQSGSTERRKIENWAEICYQLVQWARSTTRTSSMSWKAFMQMLPVELRTFAVRRRVKLYHAELRHALDLALAGTVLAKEQSEVLAPFALETITGHRVTTRMTAPVQVQVAVATRRSNRIMGQSVCSVLRRMGQLGITETQARRAMVNHNVTVEASTVRFMLRAGERGEGRVAQLSPQAIYQIAGVEVSF